MQQMSKQFCNSSQVCCNIASSTWAAASEILPHSSAKDCGLGGVYT